MDKATRKNNRRRDFKRQMKGRVNNAMLAIRMAISPATGEAKTSYVSGGQIFIPTHSMAVKAKRMATHRERCRRK